MEGRLTECDISRYVVAPVEKRQFALLDGLLLLRPAQSSAKYCAPSHPGAMSDNRGKVTDSWLSLVLRDVHFWVPLAVLVAGLLVLRWIS